MSMVKAYELKHSANHGKLKEVIKVAEVYRNLAVSIASEQWMLFQKRGSLFRGTIGTTQWVL
jgi:hypothetical protein